jgi:hypothetical protein
VADDLTPSVPGPSCSYADASIYVDAVDSSEVIAWLQDSLGLEGSGQCLIVGPVRVSGAHNDYATGRRFHPFDFLEWQIVLECEAPSGEPADVVAAVTAVLETLWRGGFEAVTACDFEDDLPARGGRERYPMPAASHSSAAPADTWWRSLLPFAKRNG